MVLYDSFYSKIEKFIEMTSGFLVVTGWEMANKISGDGCTILQIYLKINELYILKR